MRSYRHPYEVYYVNQSLINCSVLFNLGIGQCNGTYRTLCLVAGFIKHGPLKDPWVIGDPHIISLALAVPAPLHAKYDSRPRHRAMMCRAIGLDHQKAFKNCLGEVARKVLALVGKYDVLLPFLACCDAIDDLQSQNT